MKRVKLFILVLLIFTLTSCSKLKKGDEDEFLDIINTPIENCTYHMDIKMEMKNKDVEVTANMEIDAEVSEKEMYMSAYIMDQYDYVYAKKDQNAVYSWEYDGSHWVKQPPKPLTDFNNNNMLPDEEIEEGDFEYEDGVWVGNTRKLEEKLSESFLTSLELTGMETNANFDLKKYNIIIEDGEITQAEIKIEFTMEESGNEIEVVLTYKVYFSKHGETVVTVPFN